MKLSIKTKVTAVIILALAAGAVALITVVQRSYDENVKMIAKQSLDSARKGFKNLEDNDFRALNMSSASLLTNEHLKATFASRNREALYKELKPYFDEMKSKFGVKGFLFAEPEPSKKVFLRMNTPEKFGEVFKPVVFEESVKSKKRESGSELTNLGYILNCVAPIQDQSGKLLGYLALGDTYDDFLQHMQQQSGDQYQMVAVKSHLDEKLYRVGQERKKLKDYWDEFKDVVVLSATSDDHGKTDLGKEIANLPAEGKILGTIEKEGKTYIRAVFPLIDATNGKIGGVFVLHDVSAIHAGMASVRSAAIGAIVALMLLLSFGIVLTLNKLVFARLNHTMEVTTRVVGGDFETQIVPVSDDEVGQLENLLEQFRTVFVNVVHELDERDESRKSA